MDSLDQDTECSIAFASYRGLFYAEVLAGDHAISTICEQASLKSVPARAELLKSVPAGMYMVGRDISPELYKGETAESSSCWWERISSLAGERGNTVAFGTPEGAYFVVVTASDVAVRFACAVEKVE